MQCCPNFFFRTRNIWHFEWFSTTNWFHLSFNEKEPNSSLWTTTTNKQIKIERAHNKCIVWMSISQIMIDIDQFVSFKLRKTQQQYTNLNRIILNMLEKIRTKISSLMLHKWVPFEILKKFRFLRRFKSDTNSRKWNSASKWVFLLFSCSSTCSQISSHIQQALKSRRKEP